MSAIPRIYLLLDWDCTLTTTDTLPVVAAIGYSHRHRMDLRSISELPEWSRFSEEYLKDLHNHESSYVPRQNERRNVKQELLYLASLKDVERRSVERVEKAGVFRGTKYSEIQEAARSAMASGKVTLRKGWKALVDQVRAGGGRVGIVSVNWSASFIEECLSYAGARPGIEVIANEIEGIKCNEGGSGNLDRRLPLWLDGHRHVSGIWTAKDKKMAMDYIIERWREEDRNGSEFVRMFYVGDSSTDLGCLINADVGIVISDKPRGQSSMKALMDRVEVQVRDIQADVDDLRTSKEKMGFKDPVLWWARDFDEILRSSLLSG